MPTLNSLFRTPEFTALFGAWAAQAAGGTVGGLALSSLVYARTESPLLSALSLFGPNFAQVIGAMTLLSAADRLPPRAVLVIVALIFAAGTFALTIPGLPIWGLLTIIFALGLANSLVGGVRWGLVEEIVPAGSFILARSVFTASLGVMQIAGFIVGGVVISAMSPRPALLLSGALYVVSATILRLGLTTRRPRAVGRPSVRETWRVNSELWLLPARRHIYLALWVPNGLVVGCEALFVPYASTSAGVLFMAAAFGMLFGDIIVGRFIPQHWWSRLLTPLRVLLAAPFLLFALPFGLPLPIAVIAVAVAALGFSAGLPLQNRLVLWTPSDIRGQALGLHTAGMLTMQAVGAAIAGSVAQYSSPASAMGVMAIASLAVTLALIPGLAQSAVEPTTEKAIARSGLLG